jgi:hypothetical protein
MLMGLMAQDPKSSSGCLSNFLTRSMLKCKTPKICADIILPTTPLGQWYKLPLSGFQVFVTSHLLHRSTHPYDGPALIFMRGICQPSHTPLTGYAPIMLCQSTSKPNIFPVIT